MAYFCWILIFEYLCYLNYLNLIIFKYNSNITEQLKMDNTYNFSLKKNIYYCLFCLQFILNQLALLIGELINKVFTTFIYIFAEVSFPMINR